MFLQGLIHIYAEIIQIRGKAMNINMDRNIGIIKNFVYKSSLLTHRCIKNGRKTGKNNIIRAVSSSMTLNKWRFLNRFTYFQMLLKSRIGFKDPFKHSTSGRLTYYSSDIVSTIILFYFISLMCIKITLQWLHLEARSFILPF